MSKLADNKKQIKDLADKLFDAEVMLAFAVNGAPVLEKGNWRVLIRHSPRYPDDLSFAKIAIFQKADDAWQLFCYGEFHKIQASIRERCDCATEPGREYLMLCELMVSNV